MWTGLCCLATEAMKTSVLQPRRSPDANVTTIAGTRATPTVATRTSTGRLNDGSTGSECHGSPHQAGVYYIGQLVERTESDGTATAPPPGRGSEPSSPSATRDQPPSYSWAALMKDRVLLPEEGEGQPGRETPPPTFEEAVVIHDLDFQLLKETRRK